MGLSNLEQETIINFNKEEDIAYIFTYEKTWQKYLEERGFSPTETNSFGGKFYEIPKKMVKKPRMPVKISEATRKARADRLKRLAKTN